MAPDKEPVLRKLKFKITSKGIRNDLEEKSSGETTKIDLGHKANRVVNEHSEFNMTAKPCVPATSKKRGPEVYLESQRGKLRKMDRSVKLQCGSVLRELMNSHCGWIFNEPVDPVKLNIPDYFSIITQPMDLGTIKAKLEGNLYFSADEFAADVRLTFSNAMFYNPPSHDVHKFAKKLDGNFCRKWKLLEGKWNHEKHTNVVNDSERIWKDSKQTVETDTQGKAQMGLKRAPLRVNLSMNRPMPLEEKQRLKLEIVELSARKMTEDLRTVFDKFGLTGLRGEALHSYIDATDDKTLWKLRREIKVSPDGSGQQVTPAKMAQNRSPLSGKTVQKGTEKSSQSACASACLRQAIDATEAKCSCGSSSCHCHVKNASAQASSDLSSERSAELDHCGDSKLDFEVKCPLSSHASRLGPDSEGPGVVLNEESSSHLSTPVTNAASGEGWTSLSIQMSPKKALRAAMLKSRFADTIFRATHGENSDPGRMQKEKKRLEMEQLEEKLRIEKEIKAAEAAMRMRVQAELKMRREREREAARIALQNVEKTVEINENLQILKDLEILCYGSPLDEDGMEVVGAVHTRNPLERLGLFMKDDYLEEEDEEAILNGEDGEILS